MKKTLFICMCILSALCLAAGLLYGAAVLPTLWQITPYAVGQAAQVPGYPAGALTYLCPLEGAQPDTGATVVYGADAAATLLRVQADTYYLQGPGGAQDILAVAAADVQGALVPWYVPYVGAALAPAGHYWPALCGAFAGFALLALCLRPRGRADENDNPYGLRHARLPQGEECDKR